VQTLRITSRLFFIAWVPCSFTASFALQSSLCHNNIACTAVDGLLSVHSPTK